MKTNRNKVYTGTPSCEPKINNNQLYAIAKTRYDGLIITDWFNWRVYQGRYVMSAYKQIKNKEDYKIYAVGLDEVANV